MARKTKADANAEAIASLSAQLAAVVQALQGTVPVATPATPTLPTLPTPGATPSMASAIAALSVPASLTADIPAVVGSRAEPSYQATMPCCAQCGQRVKPGIVVLSGPDKGRLVPSGQGTAYLRTLRFNGQADALRLDPNGPYTGEAIDKAFKEHSRDGGGAQSVPAWLMGGAARNGLKLATPLARRATVEESRLAIAAGQAWVDPR